MQLSVDDNWTFHCRLWSKRKQRAVRAWPCCSSLPATPVPPQHVASGRSNTGNVTTNSCYL